MSFAALLTVAVAPFINSDALADVRARQVEISARIVEVSQSDIAELGFDRDAIGQATGRPAVVTRPTDIPPLPDDIVIRGLGSPRITALDGQQAVFDAVEEVPILAAGGVDPVILPAGLQLQIVPVIQPDGSITMSIDSRVSMPSFEQGVPSLATRTMDTSVQMRSGQSVAIGGLFTDTDRATAARVPALGDLPMIGQLFRSERFQRGESDLLIFISPVIIVSDEDAPMRGISVSVSGSGGYGEIDRGNFQLPIRVETGGQFQDAPEFDTAGTEFFSTRFGLNLDLGRLTGERYLVGKDLGAYFSYGFSEFDGFDSFLAGGDVNPGMDGSALLDPGGLNGNLGGGGIKLVDNGIGFADHTDIRATSDYEEFRLGLSLGRSYALGGGVLKPRGGFFYGRTDDEGGLSGMTGNGSVDYRYDNELTSDRFGLEFSMDAAIPLIEGVELYLRPQVEVSRGFADASSSVQVDVNGAPFASSSADGIDHSFTSFGYSAAAGVRIDLAPNITVDVGGSYESWEGTMLEFEPEQEVEITTPRRDSWIIGAGINFGF